MTEGAAQPNPPGTTGRKSTPLAIAKKLPRAKPTAKISRLGTGPPDRLRTKAQSQPPVAAWRASATVTSSAATGPTPVSSSQPMIARAKAKPLTNTGRFFTSSE